VRLNKYIASCGAASRRGADDLIAAGRVTVNGTVPGAMGYDVDVNRDMVCLDGVAIRPAEEKVYIMLNKPAGCLSACTDARGRQTVVDIIGDSHRLFPVGRLDIDTEGLLLLTNDGDFAYWCMHPSHEVPKTYYVVVKGLLSDEALQTLSAGVDIDGKRTQPAKIHIKRRSSKRTELTMVIREGMNRQIKKMFQLAGCRVSYLQRIAIGPLTLGSLKSGQWRYLTQEDMKKLGYNT
jgi:23S rRNA pseudouridine2605 synthase